MRYIHNIFIAIDQLINTILGGDPDMTISARLGRNYRGTKIEKIVDWIFSYQNNPEGHCENADEWEKDEGKDAIIK